MAELAAPKTSWLERAPEKSEGVWLPLAVLAWDYVISSIVAAFLEVRGWLPESPIYTELPIFSWYLPLELIIPAAGEEVLFRIAPLILAMNKWGTRWPTMIVLLASSVLFGISHGGAGYILLQGVSGFFYGLLFIKFSESGKRYLRASALVIAVHIIFNVLVILTLVSYGETTW